MLEQNQMSNQTGKNRTPRTYAQDSTNLYQRCLRGDEDAWEYIHNFVHFIVGRKCRTLRFNIDDMAQEIVYHLLNKGIDSVKNPAAFCGYIKKVTTNYICDRFRKKILFTVSLDNRYDDDRPVWEPASPAPGPLALTMERNLSELIDKGIALLSQKCQEALNGYIAWKKDGKYADYEDLARSMGLKVSTLSSRVTRCLEKLINIPEIHNWLEA
jgi:RNA polymerase sigma factor (sigma-70 family)